MEIVSLAKYGEIGLVIASLVVLIIVFKSFLEFISKSETRHQEMQMRIIEVVNKNTETSEKVVKQSEEVYNYLKLQNGSFKDLMKETRDTLASCPTNVKIRRSDG